MSLAITGPMIAANDSLTITKITDRCRVTKRLWPSGRVAEMLDMVILFFSLAPPVNKRRRTSNA